MRRARPTGVVAALLAVLVVVVASCSVPTDRKPRAIPRQQLADLFDTARESPTSAAGPNANTVSLYMFVNNMLTPIARKTDQVDARSVIGLLLQGPTDNERVLGITTFIPPHTRLLRTQLTPDGTLMIDLSSEMDSISGSSAKAAYAQFVFTATSLPTVTQVQFRTGGKVRLVPTDEGDRPVADQASFSHPFVVAGGGGTPATSSIPPLVPTTTTGN